MKFLGSVLLALTAAASVTAQNNDTNAFATGLLDALKANNLSALANAIQANSAALLPALISGNKTVLAPSDAAINALGNVDKDVLVATISYHVLNGTYKVEELAAGKKVIAPSALTDRKYVELPGNRSQVVVLSQQSSNKTAYVQEAGRNASFLVTKDGPQYRNVLVQPIDQVIQIPGKTSAIAGALGASQLATLLQQRNLVKALDDTDAVTVFAPTNQAFEAVQQTIAAASPEAQTAVLLNHVVNGTVAYSTALDKVPKATTASGQEITLTTNSTGAFVTSGNITAKIIGTDYVASNGVIHIIDQVLVNTKNDPKAAASAASSAEAAAATQTGNPVGVGSNAGSGSSKPPKGENSAFATKVSGGLAIFAVIASGIFVLA